MVKAPNTPVGIYSKYIFILHVRSIFLNTVPVVYRVCSLNLCCFETLNRATGKGSNEQGT